MASPLPRQPPKYEQDLIVPARQETLRVLKAAASAGVKRVVMTSSLAAVLHCHVRDEVKVFNETNWSRIDLNIGAYAKSKTLAELAAWDFVSSLSGIDRLELSIINPGVVLGPLLDNNYSTSGEVVRKLMRRKYPGCPKLGWSVVDVRDVAAAHIAAMIIPEAAGQRFCCALTHAWMWEIAEILNKSFASKGYKIPTRKLPNFLVYPVALFDKTARLAIIDLGRQRNVSNEKIRKVLDWKPHSLEEMVVAMGESTIEYGVV